MSPRAGLTTEAVVDLALAVVDEAGPGYRAYLRRHPHRTGALVTSPDSGDAELAKATHAVAEVAFAVLRPFGFDHERAVHATRCIRAAVHGFAGLEASGGFGRPEDVDQSFEVLKTMLVDGITNYAKTL